MMVHMMVWGPLWTGGRPLWTGGASHRVQSGPGVNQVEKVGLGIDLFRALAEMIRQPFILVLVAIDEFAREHIHGRKVGALVTGDDPEAFRQSELALDGASSRSTLLLYRRDSRPCEPALVGKVTEGEQHGLEGHVGERIVEHR